MNYFELPVDVQRRVLQQTSVRIGLPEQAIEKDLWVTTILQLLFSLPFSNKMVFKGGTSLSKVWNQIERFSEDIDIAVDRELFGFEGDLTKLQIKKLRKAFSVFVREQLSEQLRGALVQCGLSSFCKLEAEPDGEGNGTYPEPRKLFVKYSSVLQSPSNYLSPEVMLEVGARSLMEPSEKACVTSMVENVFSEIHTSEDAGLVATALPGKTFLEKAFLIHEMFSVDGVGANAERKSRHLYDLMKMMEKDFATAAIKDKDLWESIRHHREIFTSMKGVDYSKEVYKRIVLVPRPDILKLWEEDYRKMSSSMIYGTAPPFNELIHKMKVLQEYIRSI